MSLVEPIIAALITFILMFALLRAVEWVYHRLLHTRDWSPHWGTWLFAILTALYVLVSELGH